MVGVGGRSKACDNCKRRRVKCDLGSPECARCIKARLRCGGRRDITIIQYGAGNTTTSSDSESSSNGRSHDDKKESAKRVFSLADGSPRLSVRSGLTMSPDDKFVAYLLPKLRRAHHAISLGPGADRTLTNKCFLALSTAYFGVAHNDRPITEHGLRRYSRSLNELNLALRDPNSCRSFDVLEAVVIMAVMEYLVSDNQHGWIMHTQGVEKLFQVRQPRHTTSLPCLLLLERTRASMIFRAILLQQRTIMSLSDWKTIPWRDHPERADSMKHLLDIIADFPDLYCSRFEILTAGRSADGKTLPELLLSAFGLLQDLHEWRSAWAGHIRPSYVKANLDTPHFVDADGRSLPKWTTNIEYDSLLHAQLMHFYYGAVILVGIFIRKGLPDTPEATVDISSVLREIHTSAAAICRGADYQIKTVQPGGTEHLSLFFPLRMAYEGIGQSDPVIAAWLGGCIARISSGSAGNWASARRLFQSGQVP